MVRGGGLGVIHRNMGFWDKVQQRCTDTCTLAADTWWRMQREGRQGQQQQQQQQHRKGKAKRRPGLRSAPP